MEKIPNKNAGGGSTYEHPTLGSFEVIELQSIKGSDIESGDRAFIHTRSGNRYMLRHSKSRGGELVIYNEREGGFVAENARTFKIRAGEQNIAEVGKSFEYFEIRDETTGAGNVATTTPISRIEVRKGLEEAVEKASSSNNSFGDIVEMMKNEVKGRRS